MQLDIRYKQRHDRETKPVGDDQNGLSERYADLIRRREEGYEWAKNNPRALHGPDTPSSPVGFGGDDEETGAIISPCETAGRCQGGGDMRERDIASPPSCRAARGGGLAAVGHAPRSAPPLEFDGVTYDSRQDKERLATALERVWELMRDGEWRTLRCIADEVGCSEAGASARLRDLRKRKISAILPTRGVQAKRATGGLWVYRVDVPQEWRR